MAIIQSLFSSSYQFAPSGLILNGAEGTCNNPINGLFKRVYDGYFADNVAFFDTATITSTDADTVVEMSNVGTGYSVQWTGYWVVPSTGIYTFNTTSDDASYLWLGNNAKSGYTTSNAIVNNGSAHGPATVNSLSYAMTAGDYYPIRIQFGQDGGGDLFNMQISYNNGNYNPLSSFTIVYSSGTAEGFN
jgi:hypothetical protein